MASLTKSVSSLGNASMFRRSFSPPLPVFLAFFRSRFVVFGSSSPMLSELVSVVVVPEVMTEPLRGLHPPSILLGVNVMLAWSMAFICRIIRRMSLCLLWCISSEELQLIEGQSNHGTRLSRLTQSIHVICLKLEIVQREVRKRYRKGGRIEKTLTNEMQLLMEPVAWLNMFSDARCLGSCI